MAIKGQCPISSPAGLGSGDRLIGCEPPPPHLHTHCEMQPFLATPTDQNSVVNGALHMHNAGQHCHRLVRVDEWARDNVQPLIGENN